MPNDSRLSILLVVADDLRPELGVQGYNVSTPHLDALASRGVRLALAYSSWPVCAPSRASLFTSRTPDSLGVYHCCHCWSDTSGRRPTLFKIFRDAGYRTAAYGKVYGPDPGCAALNSELSTPHAALWGGGARGEAKAPGCKVRRVNLARSSHSRHTLAHFHPGRREEALDLRGQRRGDRARPGDHRGGRRARARMVDHCGRRPAVARVCGAAAAAPAVQRACRPLCAVPRGGRGAGDAGRAGVGGGRAGLGQLGRAALWHGQTSRRALAAAELAT